MAYGKSINNGNFQPGLQLINGSWLMNAFSKMFQGGVDRADGLTAHAGGTKAAALALSHSFNRISTCATSADSVLLPKAIAGSMITVTNSGAVEAAIYGAVADTIDGAATATAAYLSPHETKIFVCLTSGSWKTVRAPTIQRVTTVAAAGATQGNATSVSAARVCIVTVTASTQGIKLPVAVTGLRVEVFAAQTVGVKVYPASGAKLQGAATNVAVVLASNKANIYQAINGTTWRVIKGA